MLASQINIDCTYTLEFNGKNIDGKARRKYNLYRSKFHKYQMIFLVRTLCCVARTLAIATTTFLLCSSSRARVPACNPRYNQLRHCTNKAKKHATCLHCRCALLLLTLAHSHPPVCMFYEFSIGSVRIVLSHSLLSYTMPRPPSNENVRCHSQTNSL